jgi:hypothetical protein
MGQGRDAVWRDGGLMPIDLAKLQEAVNFAIASETPWDRENSDNWGIHNADQPPCAGQYPVLYESADVK